MYKIGITVGDINGIGLETIIKALSNPKMLKLFTPVIYGSAKVISYHKNIVKGADFTFTTCNSGEKAIPKRINVVNCTSETTNVEIGKPTKDAGKFAHIALDRAVQDLKSNHIDGLVTAPINKHTMDPQGFPFAGHTEYLSHSFNTKESLMLMVSEDMRVGLVTNHLPIKDITTSITKELITKKVQIFEKTLKQDFGIEKPTIAVLGLNPHAGDAGKIGKEEEELIRPVIINLKKKGVVVVGPYAADGFFGSGKYKKVDGVLAMFHDQGLVPFKALSFGSGVNYTAGLPIIRTSPDHGTAYDIAGQNLADESSMRSAIFLALDIIKSRANHKEMWANNIKKKPKQPEEVLE